MSYPQYTEPVEANSYLNVGNQGNNQYFQMLFAAAALGIPVSVIVYLTMPVSGICWAIDVELMLTISGLAYCHWWLDDRLIALPQDTTQTSGPAVDMYAVGMVISTEPGFDWWQSWSAYPFLGNLDTDWTFCLMLQGETLSTPDDQGTNYTVQNGLMGLNPAPSSPYAYLIDEQLASHDLGLTFSGYPEATSKADVVNQTAAGYFVANYYDGSSQSLMDGGTTFTAPSLHCEIEGPGVYDMQQFLRVAFGMESAALIACLIDGPIGLAIAAILAILAFLLSLFGGLFSPSQTASPSDIGGSASASLHTPDQNGNNASIVGVTGTWVYDSAHTGWNELHPVKSVVPFGSYEAGTIATGELIAAAGQLMGGATAPSTITNQSQPQNQWQIHPLIDGCGSYPSNPPPENIQ